MTGIVRTSDYYAEITKWTGALSADGSEMTGSATLVARFGNAWGPQVILEEFEILSLRRQYE